jgi:hypothetical protein
MKTEINKKINDLVETIKYYQPKEKSLQTSEGIKRFLQQETKNIEVLTLCKKKLIEARIWLEEKENE